MLSLVQRHGHSFVTIILLYRGNRYIHRFLLKIYAAWVIEAFVITDISRPYTVRLSSGTCMKYQGNGCCLVVGCQAERKCDSLPYERSSILGTTRYTIPHGLIRSFQNQFVCPLMSDARNCTTFSSFIDTISMTDYTMMEASLMVIKKIEDIVRSL